MEIKRYRESWKKNLGRLSNKLAPVRRFLKKYFGWLRYANLFRYISILDWYIIKKFIGTYFFSIILIISISIVFDVNENLNLCRSCLLATDQYTEAAKALENFPTPTDEDAPTAYMPDDVYVWDF